MSIGPPRPTTNGMKLFTYIVMLIDVIAAALTAVTFASFLLAIQLFWDEHVFYFGTILGLFRVMMAILWRHDYAPILHEEATGSTAAPVVHTR